MVVKFVYRGDVPIDADDKTGMTDVFILKEDDGADGDVGYCGVCGDRVGVAFDVHS